MRKKLFKEREFKEKDIVNRYENGPELSLT